MGETAIKLSLENGLPMECNRSVNVPETRQHFKINVDEEGSMASQNKSKVYGSKAVKKHETAGSDCRDSISTMRGGSAAGEKAPNVYLMKGMV